MPATVEVREAERRVIVTVTGSMTFREVAHAAASVRVGEVIRYGMLIDLTDADVPVTTFEVERMVNHTVTLRRASGQRGAVAIVAHRNADYGMWRMFEILAEMADVDAIRVFRTAPEAAGWLDAMALLPSLTATDQHKSLGG
jgi:hypothetical protein